MAFIQKQLYPIPFQKGIDTKTDSKQVLAGNLLTLENGEFTNPGQINKRTGYDILPNIIQGTSNSINEAQAINSYNGECLLFDGVNVYTYIEELSSWAQKGTAQSVVTKDKQIIRTNSAQQLNPDIAIANNIELYVWEDSRNGGSIRYSIIDAATQAIIVSDTSLVSGYAVKPKCVSFNGQFYIFYTNGLTNLYYKTISPLNATNISTATEIAGDGYLLQSSVFSYDVAVIGTKIYCSYLSSHLTAGQIALLSINQNNVLTTENYGASGTTAIDGYSYTSVMNVVGDSEENIWQVWSNGIAIYGSCHTQSMIQSLSPTLVYYENGVSIANTITSIEAQTARTLQITAEIYAALPYNQRIVSYTLTKEGVATLLGTLRSVGLASKAYNINGNIYVNLAYQSTLNSTYFTSILTGQNPFAIVGKISPSLGGGLRTNQMLSEIPFSSTNIVKWANLNKGAIISEASTIFSLLGVNSTTLDYENSNRFLTVTQNNNLHIVGGILQIYDGISVVETNFNVPPENITTSVSTGGGSLGIGSYQYLVTYEWTDNYGQIEISTPSPVITVTTTTATSACKLIIPTLRLTAKKGIRANVSICIYRTAANGTLFNEVTSIIAPLSNNPLVDTVIFTDTISDITASSNRFIYTTGGVLNNVSPPSCSLISLYQNRIVISGLEDPNLILYSQNKQDYSNYNTTPTNFAAENTIGCDPLGGPITAIKNLDQNLIIFKKTNIFIVQGDGPNNAGGGSSYPNPEMLASDVGCSNPNSIGLTPNGLMFQSDKGIYLLDRSLNVIFIGAPIQSYNDLTITSTTLVPDKNQVIFTTTLGTALVYDYYVGQWSTFTNHFAEDSIVFQNLFTYITSNGLVYQSNPNKFTDGSIPIYMSWTSPNLSFAQLSGYQRVFNVVLLGTYKGNHTLNVNVAYDFNDVYTQNCSIQINPTNTAWGTDGYWGQGTPFGGTFQSYQFRIDFAQQVCTAIRIQISDSMISSYNEGYAISAMTFTVGILPDTYKGISTKNIFGAS